MCILLLPTFDVAFTQWRYCTLSSWNLLRCSSRPFEGKPTRQTQCPIRPQCYTALCGRSVPENPGACSFWKFFLFEWIGKAKTELGDWFESVIWLVELVLKSFELVFGLLIFRQKSEMKNRWKLGWRQLQSAPGSIPVLEKAVIWQFRLKGPKLKNNW